MPAQAESGGDTREFERRAQEYLAQVFAVRGVIAAPSPGVLKPDRAVGFPLAVEFGREHPPESDRSAAVVEGLENDPETVPAAQIAMKIHVAPKNVRQLDRNAIRNPRGIGRREERGLDPARFHLYSARHIRLLLESAESVAHAIRREKRVPVGEERYRAQPADFVDFCLNRSSGEQKAERPRGTRRPQKRGRFLLVGPEPADQSGQRVAASEAVFLKVDDRSRVADRGRGQGERLDDRPDGNRFRNVRDGAECSHDAKQRHGDGDREPSEAPCTGARYNSHLVVMHVRQQVESKKSNK